MEKAIVSFETNPSAKTVVISGYVLKISDERDFCVFGKQQ